MVKERQSRLDSALLASTAFRILKEHRGDVMCNGRSDQDAFLSLEQLQEKLAYVQRTWCYTFYVIHLL